MKALFRLFLPFIFLVGCHKSPQQLPEISEADLQKAATIEQTLQQEIEKGDLLEALETEDGELQQRGFLVSRFIKKLIDLILPEHLEAFDRNHTGLNEKQETFVEYRGVYGRCHQFRVFYKYKDSRVENVEWASSVLSVPVKDKSNINAGVVLAPTLDGFTPFIESGLWLKLCRKGLATLMPESLYRKQEGQWQKLHFDPTPPYKTVDEYSLYEESIQRYEFVLNKNVEILRSFDTLMTDRQDRLVDFNIMNVEPQRVGFWGSSFGAVVGALVVAKDPKIKAAVLTVGGGDLPYVVSRSKISLFKKTRRAQMKLLGINSINEYEAFISQYLQSDPLKYAKKTDAKRLYMILAKKDKSVPTKAQYELYNQFGQPENSRLRAGHVLTLLFTSWFNSGISRRSIDSLIQKLEKEPRGQSL